MKKRKQEAPSFVNIKDTENHDRYDDVYSETTPGKWESHILKKNAVLIKSENNVLLKIQFIDENIIRIRYALKAFEKHTSYAISKHYKKVNVGLKITELKNAIEIVSPTARLLVTKKNLKVSIYNTEGKLLSQDKRGFVHRSTILKGDTHVSLQKSITKTENFYGLGDKSSALNLRKKKFENWNTDAFAYGPKTDPLYKTIPFFYGLKNDIAYGVFFDNSHRSFFDFDSKNKNELSFGAEGGELNYYFILGPDLNDVAQRYTLLTGTPELPPMWGLGYHQCRWSYYPEKRVLNLAKKFRDKKIPCDSIYLDIDYMDGFRCFTWSKKLFPNLKKVIAKIKEKGFDTVVMIDPGIKEDENYSVYQEGIKNGYFCKRTDGNLMVGPVWPENCVFPDFTNKAVRKWWGNLYKELYNDQDVSGFWNDMNEPAVFKVNSKTFPDEVMHHMEGNPTNHRRAHNIYGMQMSRATFKGLKKLRKNKRPFVLTRATYSGGQRYASVWTGDNIASWEQLQLANTQTQRMSVSGFSFVGSDIGGFVNQPTPELMCRWLQLAVFHPFFRVHSIGNREDGSAGIDDNPEELKEVERLDQEPWAFGEETTVLTRKAIEFRYKLLPYIYSTFNDYVVEGKPMVRSLIFEDQTDKKLYNTEREFLFGEHLFISAVTRAKAKSQKIYFPKGTWFDFKTGEKYIGGDTHKVSLTPDRIPVFARAGAVIPMHPVRQHTKEKVNQLQFRIFLDEGNFDSWYYEDKGEGYDYLADEYKEIQFEFNATKKKIVGTSKSFGLYKMPYKNYFYQLYGVPEKMIKISIDGKSVPFTRTDGIVRISTNNLFKEIVIS